MGRNHTLRKPRAAQRGGAQRLMSSPHRGRSQLGVKGVKTPIPGWNRGSWRRFTYLPQVPEPELDARAALWCEKPGLFPRDPSICSGIASMHPTTSTPLGDASETRVIERAGYGVHYRRSSSGGPSRVVRSPRAGADGVVIRTYCTAVSLV